LAVNAAKGNQRAQRLFTQLLSSVEKDNKRLHDEWLNTAIDYKIEWERELERRARLGIQAPVPVPHPDDIIIDVQNGSVRVTGPMTKEEKAKWDEATEFRDKAFEEVGKLKELLASDPDHPERKEIEAEIKYVEETFRRIDNRLSTR
jgi:HSP20 family molecular chaperone IbpA